jgi:hypothetical protein
MWYRLIEGPIQRQCWWRWSPKPGQNGPSTTATHIIIDVKAVYDSVVDEPQLKIPNRVNQQITKQTSNGWGRGWTPTKKELKFSCSLFRGLFQSKIWCKAFQFQEGRVPDCQSTYIIWKVLLSVFYRYCSFIHIWRVSNLKNIWRFFMQTQGLSFNPSAIFHRLHSSLLVSDKRLKSSKCLLKIDLSFVLNCHPDLPWYPKRMEWRYKCGCWFTMASPF